MGNSSNRAARISRSHRVLKKHYKPVAPPADRTVLEHLLYACLLENARFDRADDAFVRVQQAFYDWNETRVATVSELAELLSTLPDARGAATRLKKALQGVYESIYSFDLEPLRKQNLGQAVRQFESAGIRWKFVLAYVTQNALGGHAIAVSEGSRAALRVTDIITEAEARREEAPGLDRAIPKNRGGEYFSLLHQLGADYYATPFSKRVRDILVEINPAAKEQLPRRSGKRGETGDGAAREKPAARKAARSPAKGTRRKAAGASSASSGASARKKSSTRGLARKKPR